MVDLTLGLHGRPHIGSAWSTSLTLGLSGRPHTGRPHAHWVSVVDLTLGLQSDLEQVQRRYEHYIPGHALYRGTSICVAVYSERETCAVIVF